MDKVSFDGISEWFTGKAAEKARWACDQINASLDEGEWLPGVSRTVRASLNKLSATTKKRARLADKVSEQRPYDHGTDEERVKPLRHALWNIGHRMYFGGPTDRMEGDVNILASRQDLLTSEEKTVLDTARAFTAAFKPVWAAIKFLDAQRPKPVFVFKTLSPTGARLLQEAGYKPDSARLPKFVYHREPNEKGEMVCWIEIIWPEGTLHGKSRFIGGSRAGNEQCHACGHAIKRPDNWVPLALDNQNGEIHSFWVGRDCAKKLFGVEMKGEAKYRNPEGR